MTHFYPFSNPIRPEEYYLILCRHVNLFCNLCTIPSSPSLRSTTWLYQRLPRRLFFQNKSFAPLFFLRFLFSFSSHRFSRLTLLLALVSDSFTLLSTLSQASHTKRRTTVEGFSHPLTPSPSKKFLSYIIHSQIQRCFLSKRFAIYSFSLRFASLSPGAASRNLTREVLSDLFLRIKYLRTSLQSLLLAQRAAINGEAKGDR